MSTGVRIGEVLEIGDIAFYIRPFFGASYQWPCAIGLAADRPCPGQNRRIRKRQKVAAARQCRRGLAIKTAIDGYFFGKSFRRSVVADDNSMYGNVYSYHCIKLICQYFHLSIHFIMIFGLSVV